MEKINFKKGESISIGFLLNAGYDIARIQSCSAWLGGKKLPLATIGQMLRCEIESTETHLLAGKYKLILWLDDSILGIKKIEVTDVEVSFNHANDNNTSINTGYDFVFPLAINELAITLGDILYDYVKGADGEHGIGILSNELISTVGLVKTYRITYTDNTTFDYEVRDGENGEDGAPAVLPPNIVIDANYTHTDNNYTDETVLEVTKIANKVDKVAGKSLIADTEITRLATVENYDDTNVLNAIATKETANPNIQQHISATGNPHATKLTDLTNEALTDTAPTDTDSVITKVGTAIKASTFSSIYTYIKDKLLAASHTWALLQTFTSGLKTSKIIPNGTTLAIRNQADTEDVVKVNTNILNSGILSVISNVPINDSIGFIKADYTGNNTDYSASILSKTTYGVSQLFQWGYRGTRLGSRQKNGIGLGDLYLTYGNDKTGLYIKGDNGNIGLNTETPETILDVNGTTTHRDWVYLNNGTHTGDAVGDRRFKVVSGVLVTQACSVANATKGAGTWVNVGVQLSDNTATASVFFEGCKRYRKDSNNSYEETCMQTGASTYAWVVIKQITW